MITFGRVSFSSIFLLIIILIKKEKVRLSNKKDYILIIAAGIVMALHWFTFLQAINLIALGTLNHNSPVAIPVAISVVPTPVEKAPKAP